MNKTNNADRARITKKAAICFLSTSIAKTRRTAVATVARPLLNKQPREPTKSKGTDTVHETFVRRLPIHNVVTLNKTATGPSTLSIKGFSKAFMPGIKKAELY